MDPSGIREVFFAEHGTAPKYGVREAIRSTPFTLRPSMSQFVGLHLPLTRRLPKRLDTELQQDVGLHKYDLVVMAGIDPSVLDADDLLNLEAYVECGGGLLMTGGSSAFDLAQRGWGDLRAALPASITLPAKPRQLLPRRSAGADTMDVEAGSSDAHPILRGLSGPLGSVRSMHPIVPRDDATVLASADGKPVIVCGGHGAGRVVMVASWPQDDADMFASAGYADLLRQAVMWLVGRDCDLMIESCAIDDAPLAQGESRRLSVELSDQAPGAVQAEATIRRADPGWLSAGREPQFDDGSAQPVEVTGNTAAFEFNPEHPGLWRVQLDVAGDGWANRRITQIEVRTPTQLSLKKQDGGYVSAPEWTVPLQLDAKMDVTADLQLVDFDGNVVLELNGAGRGEVDIHLPQLEIGHYEVIATTDDDEARLRFYVAPALDHIPFTLCGTTGSSGTEEQTQWQYEYFRDRGFNAHARPNDYGQYLVQRDGQAIWGEYMGAGHLLAGHGIKGDIEAEGGSPTEPCVFSAEYPDVLRKKIHGMFESTACMPRMASLEILDEPHFYPANVCRCELCESKFRQKHGYDMPTWVEALAAKDHRTCDYFEWVNDYATEAFRQGYEMWKTFGRGPKLHHVFCGIGSGRYSATINTAEDLHWCEHADFIEFDCYNYMYPHWRPEGQLRWNEFHYLFGYFRFLGLRNQQLVGFFIQVTDRDAPVAPWDPLRAPSETLYAAVGHGAKTFHLMAKGPFTSGQNCREEKFDAFAEDVKKVQRVAPLLERAEAPRRHVAMTYPFHDRHYRVPERWLPEGFEGLGYYGREARPYDAVYPHHAGPYNLAELLNRAFGETDVIDQRAFREGPLDQYPAFVLNTTDYIADIDAEAAVRYVENGGTLICDHVPTHSTDGTRTDALRALFTGPVEPFYRDVTLTRTKFGKGRTLLVSDDLNEMYTVTFEQGEPAERDRLESVLRDYLHDAGIFPHVFCDNPEFEANVLLTPDTIVLVSVSHAEVCQQGHVTLYAPPVPVTCAVDLVTMRPYPIQKTEAGIELDLDLDEREGLILGLYAEMPTESVIHLDRTDLNRGDRLGFTVELINARSTPARGDHVIDVRVTDPGGEARRQFGGLRCTSNGVLRIDEPLAVNARTGEWTITAFDRYTTRQTEARFTVEA